MNERPDPDKLLKHVQAEEEASTLGRLKLFFGASPGVGKTYAMLEAARQRKKEGWDVVIGLVETHKRAETEALLDGFEILPRKDITYKNVTLKEFDLDGALARHPKLIVVDELAHSNAEGLRHTKRWQDVEELLDAGIDVYTTLNVQHWESLNDVVAQVTGVVVHEKVPDTFLRRAHDLELVDLSPEDLLQRLSEGKVYRGELAGRAAENFFKPGNLIALRELALRHTAERVDAQMQAFKERHAISDVWSVGDRLLVGVTGSPMSARLIRATSRMATRLHTPWLAVHVETPAFLALSAEDRGRSTENLRMAEKLGAETVTITGQDVTEEMLRLARARNVTRIILGKPARPRWKEWLYGSVVNEMARRCGNIDLHIISGVGTDASSRRPKAEEGPEDWAGLGWGTAVVGLATLLCWPLSHHLDRVNLVMIYLLGVVWAAYRFGRRASLMASILSVLSFDFFYVPPYLTFAVSDTQYVLTFGIMLSVGLLISHITGRLRQQTDTLRRREERVRLLYKLSHDLSETPDTRQMMQTACRQLKEFYQSPIVILTPDAQGNLVISAGDASVFGWTDNEKSVARWVFDKGQMAGAGSDTLAGAAGLYLPLKGLRNSVGVLGVRPADAKALMDPEQLQLLEKFASEIGGALESTRLSESAGRAEMQLEMEALKSSSMPSKIALSSYVDEKRVLFLSPDLSPEQMIRELLTVLRLPQSAKIYQAILDREKASPTLIRTDVTLPHTRVPGLKGIQVAMGICPGGTHRLWILFVSPQEDPRGHLQFLAGISACFRDPESVHMLCREESPAAVLKALRRIEAIPV